MNSTSYESYFWVIDPIYLTKITW